jgi:tetratricopeptide (TPR) repeat protein
MTQGKIKGARANSFIVGTWVILAVALLLSLVWKVKIDPTVVFLYPEHGAEWIRFPDPVVGQSQKPGSRFCVFRVRYSSAAVRETPVLTLKALKQARVFVDDSLVYDADVPQDEWKHARSIPLKSGPGPHVLRIEVKNSNGHPALLAYCKSVHLFTGEGWEVSRGGSTWQKAALVRRPQRLALSREFQRADDAFLSNMPLYLFLFLGVFLLTIRGAGRRLDQFVRARLTPSMVRNLLLICWLVLAANNVVKLPLLVGMDINGHMEYIEYTAQNKRIPLPNEGWQMFQSPLFYILSAFVYKLFFGLVNLETLYRIVRVLPLLCGLAQIELSYRAVRYVYPDRRDLQILGTVIGGLFPMNLYISQVAGNEPLAGFLSGVFVVMVLSAISRQALPKTSFFLFMGLALGLALLAKVTPILLIPAFGLALAYRFIMQERREQDSLQMFVRATLVLGLAATICGAYYLRNWAVLGKPFVGGWDPARGIVWWQDPGYRTVEQLCSFGDALFYPVYASFSGFWDGIYATMWLDGMLSGSLSALHLPWNFGFMLSTAWLSLLPSIGVIFGILAVLKRTSRQKACLYFAGSCLIIYIGAMLYLFVSVPTYSSVKATYMLGIIPCFVVLCVAGLDILLRKRLLKAAVFGMTACWAVSAYGSFFILHDSYHAEDSVYLGDVLQEKGLAREAQQHYEKAIRIDPDCFQAHHNLASLLQELGQVKQAKHHYFEALRVSPNSAVTHCGLGGVLASEGDLDAAVARFAEALRISPGYAEAHNNLGVALAFKGKLDQAAEHFRQAIDLMPDYAEAHSNLSQAYWLLGERESALREYDILKDLDTDLAKILYEWLEKMMSTR